MKVRIEDTSIHGRPRAMGEAFARVKGVEEVVVLGPRGEEKLPHKNPLGGIPSGGLLSVTHQGDSLKGDVLYTSGFKPEIVKHPQAWIWRSLDDIDGASWLTTTEAEELVEWASRGKPADPSSRPPILKARPGQPLVVAVALLAQAALDQHESRPELLERRWWARTLGGAKLPGRGALSQALTLEKRGSAGAVASPAEWRVVAEFIEALEGPLDPDSLEVSQIEACVHALRRILS